MNILYIHQYFVTPEEPGARRSYDFAKKLCDKGHKVTMLTSNRSHGNWKKIEKKNIDGIEVVYIKNFYSSEMSKYQRILSFIKFMFSSFNYARKLKDIDLVFATSTPITVIIPALYLKIRKKISFILELRDLWPEVPVEYGYLRSKILINLLHKFMNYSYKKADHIVTISEGIKNLLPIDKAEVTSIPFGADINKFTLQNNAEWKKRNGIKQSFICMYTGSLGVANNPSYLIEVAKFLRDKKHNDIFIALIGEGGALSDIKRKIEENELNNIRIFKPLPVNKLNEVYASSQVGIVLFGNKGKTHRYTGSPNKFFDYIGAGLPVLFNHEGPLKDQIEKWDCGLYSSSLEPKVMAANIIKLCDDKKLLEEMSKNARKFAEEELDRDKLSEEFVELIERYK